MNKLKVLKIAKEPTGLPGFYQLGLSWVEESLSTVLRDNLITERESEFNAAYENFINSQTALYGCYNVYGAFNLTPGIYYSEVKLDEIVKYYSSKMECTRDFVKAVLGGKAFATIRDIARQASNKIIASWTESETYLNTQTDITLQHLTDALGDISRPILDYAGCKLIISTLGGLDDSRLTAKDRYSRVVDISDVGYAISTSDSSMILTPVLTEAKYSTFTKFRKVAAQLGSTTNVITLPLTGLDDLDVSLIRAATQKDSVVNLSYAIDTIKLPGLLIWDRTSNDIIKNMIKTNGGSIKGCSTGKKDVLIDRLAQVIDKKLELVPPTKDQFVVLSDFGGQIITGRDQSSYEPVVKSILGLDCLVDLKYVYNRREALDTVPLFNNLLLFTWLYKHLKGGIIFDINYHNEAYTTHNIVSGLIKRSMPIPKSLLRIK